MSSQTMPSEIEVRFNRTDETLALEEDARLRDDIRLLGRILGDTIREQEGEEVFDLVESVRQTSIRFHRDDDVIARQELESLLNGMTPRQTTRIIRAFSYFSHLANIAEDQHHIRRIARAWRRLGAARRHHRPCADPRREDGRFPRRPAARLLRGGADLPGTDRPSDGSQAQKLAEPRNGSAQLLAGANGAR